jgi:acyl transferase domain-containing protein
VLHALPLDSLSFDTDLDEPKLAHSEEEHSQQHPSDMTIMRVVEDSKHVASFTTATASAASHIPIAICGVALRLPGGLTSPQQFWEFLIAKGDARSRVPKSRYNVSAYYSSEGGKPGAVNTEYGYYLDDSIDLASFDASFWNMPRREVERVDPHQRQLLEVVRECLEDAGETKWHGSNIGCYFGSFGDDWLEMFAKDTQHQDPYRVFGFGDFMLANRISYEMDLRGPR